MARLVLVHGAFGGAWVWEPVVGPLRDRGHTVETFDLPGSGDDGTPVPEVTLDAYAERACEALGASDEPAVLVGHSMGGVVITQAAARCPDRIAKLIYLCAFLPRDGQCLEDLTKLPEGADDMVMANLVVEGEPPVGWIPPEKGHEVLFNACDEADSPPWVEKLGRQPLVPFVTPVSIENGAQDAMARCYIVCERDNAIAAGLQRRMAGATPCESIVDIDTDHMPQISATDELVDALDRLAQ